MCVCQGHLREEVGQTVCEIKERNQKSLLEVTSSSFKKQTTKVTLITLKLALESLLFFFAFEFLQNDRLNISSFCDIYFGITTTTLRTLSSGTNIFFAKGTLLSDWK